ncbi:carbohydrate kinase family protein [Archaeoglobales archaeon]|nr:MAG: carbohydrate kinase family protein [Archaeoglobales archaeon]
MIAGVGPALVDYINIIDEYPKAGGHAVVKKTMKMAGGAAANVIYGLSNFGVKCRFYSTIGEDNDAEFFKSSMQKVELKLNATHKETGKVVIYVDRYGERTFFVHPNAAGVVDLLIENKDFEEVDYFYLDPFPTNKSFEFHLNLAKKVKKFGKFVILNPGFPYTSLGFKKLSKLLKYVDMLIMSKDEFSMLGKVEEEFLEFVDYLIVTLGKNGSKCVTKNGLKVIEKPAFKTNIVDTTGAGDAFAAGFIYGFLNNLEIERCLLLGNYVASYNIQHYGARNFPSRRDIDNFILRLTTKYGRT